MLCRFADSPQKHCAGCEGRSSEPVAAPAASVALPINPPPPPGSGDGAGPAALAVWETLPDELLLHILQRLDSLRDLKATSLVCQKWAAAAETEVIWES